ncbi:MAG TPA: bifunctional phosphopantothenoylcysteine decarboxylase/phosphopantothenate--cysteine ligase CoaBC [Patescibacteria group bacterium]|nr:bifunctional phosphopantothenoylcysteine decarboxylase/phosphopantothenate--cysteine ligase CoaBC [Patescibacteria group bacterium]
MSFGDHTSKQIIGTKGDSLKGKRIVLCMTGSVAAIKSPEIARELMRQGAEVYTVMTTMAQKIVHPYMMEWSTGNPVVTELTGQIEHVTLGGDHPANADLILVAPSTANTIGKAAMAIDDTPVTTLLTTAIGADIPIIIAPAMHESMYRHPIVVENIEKLRGIGVEVLMPRFEEGKAKIPGTAEIVGAVVKRLSSSGDLEGLSIVVTGGPTREYIDGFRFISNPSSGKMGVAIAEAAMSRGAKVTLVYGPGKAAPPAGAKVMNVETTEEMLDAVVEALKDGKKDIAILSAAAADYKPAERKAGKTPSKMEHWGIDLVPVPKIIEQVKKVDPDVYLVGFKAEYNITDEELMSRASKRMGEANMDLIVANDVSRDRVGFGTDTNEVFIIEKSGEVTHVTLRSKRDVADEILDKVKEKLEA